MEHRKRKKSVSSGLWNIVTDMYGHDLASLRHSIQLSVRKYFKHVSPFPMDPAGLCRKKNIQKKKTQLFSISDNLWHVNKTYYHCTVHVLVTLCFCTPEQYVFQHVMHISMGTTVRAPVDIAGIRRHVTWWLEPVLTAVSLDGVERTATRVQP